MATNYPSSLDTFDTIAADKKTSESVGGRTHRDMHNDVADALEAVQAELGTDPAGGSATVKARFDAIEASGWVTSARILDGTIATGDLADAAVTFAKLGSDVTLGNLLTLNQASGTDTLAATTGFLGADQCTLASSTTRAYQGSRSLAATLTGTGWSFFTPYGTSGIPVVPGHAYTVQARIWMTGTGTSAARLHWFDAAGADISSVVGNAVSGAAWNLSTATGVAPANAAFAAWVASGASGTVSDVVYFDALGLWKGAGGSFSMPGSPIAHTGVRPNPSNTAEVQVWNDATATWITV